MSARIESRAHRVGQVIGQALGILLVGSVAGTIGAWVALQLARLLFALT